VPAASALSGALAKERTCARTAGAGACVDQLSVMRRRSRRRAALRRALPDSSRLKVGPDETQALTACARHRPCAFSRRLAASRKKERCARCSSQAPAEAEGAVVGPPRPAQPASGGPPARAAKRARRAAPRRRTGGATTPDLVVRDNATYRWLTDQVGSVCGALVARMTDQLCNPPPPKSPPAPPPDKCVGPSADPECDSPLQTCGGDWDSHWPPGVKP